MNIPPSFPPRFSGRVSINDKPGNCPKALDDITNNFSDSPALFSMLNFHQRPTDEVQALYQTIGEIRDEVAQDGDDAMEIKFVGSHRGFGATAFLSATYPPVEYAEFPGRMLSGASKADETFGVVKDGQDTVVAFKQRILSTYQDMKQNLDRFRQEQGLTDTAD